MSDFFNRKPVAAGRGRIKPGTMVYQDHAVSMFPVMPRDDDPIPLDTIFNFECDSTGRVSAWADGYGGGIRNRPGNYGNGELSLHKPRARAA